MASTLKINTLTGVSTAGSIAVTAEGNSTTTNLQQGLCKVWISFDGTGTVSDSSIKDSLNATSLTDNTTGNYDINFTNDIDKANDMLQGYKLIIKRKDRFYSIMKYEPAQLIESSSN